jgi:hypothetical protein
MEFALGRLMDRGESNRPEFLLLGLKFVLENPTERSEFDIPLTRARRAAFHILKFTLELADCVERAERDTLELRLKPSAERSEFDMPLTRARRAVFDVLEFTPELTDRVERAALDTLELRLKPPTEGIDGPSERDKFDTLEFTRAGCSLEFTLDRLAERAELGLVSLLEGRDSDSRCVALDGPNSTDLKNCVGYQP